MSAHFSRSEILGTVTQNTLEYEVCASLEGSFDQEHQQLKLRLESFLRATDIRVKEQHLKPSWLPQDEQLREGVGEEDAPDLAREIFHGWVSKVRKAVPTMLHT
jgi:hypothetical protein